MGSIDPGQATHTFIAHACVIHPASIVGTELDVSGDFELSITCYHGYIEDTADTNPGKFLIFASPATSGDASWAVLAEVYTAGTDPDKLDFNASEAAGQTDLTLNATTGLNPYDIVYMQDTNGGAPSASTGALSSPETLSEWGYLRKASGTTATVLFGLTNAKDSSDDFYNDATVEPRVLNVSAFKRINVAFVHEGTTGANCHIQVLGVRLTSLVTA